ncbi:MAG: hypothetical protein E7160_01620 [Firmicutes bacterium]|nr:hypothetical protein [Bacillota bacterium]
MGGIKNIEINEEWLYHAVNSRVIDKIVLTGHILSRNMQKKYGLRPKKGNNIWNGNHFISLSKKNEETGSSYTHYSQGLFALIVDDVDAIKTEQKHPDIVWEYVSKLPINKRYSYWKDEYQVRDAIPLDKVVGIKIPSKKDGFWPVLDHAENEEEMKKFIDKVEKLDFDVPYIDVDEGKVIEQDSIRDYMRKR